MSQKDQASYTPQNADEQEDIELLTRLNEGDREAFRELYTKYHDRLQRLIFSVTRDVSASQEGVNDTMLVVWQKGSSFAGRSKLRTWIMGIAYKKALKLAKSSQRLAARFGFGEGHENELLDPAGEPSVSLEMLDGIERILKQLPAKQRAVVELTYGYGYSYEEIAEIVGCPVNTVKTRMFHARASIRRAEQGGHV